MYFMDFFFFSLQNWEVLMGIKTERSWFTLRSHKWVKIVFLLYAFDYPIALMIVPLFVSSKFSHRIELVWDCVSITVLQVFMF